MSHSPGRQLEALVVRRSATPCRVAPDYEHVTAAQSKLINQLKRVPEFSSAHPAMQELNPIVYEMLLTYIRDRPLVGDR